MKQPFRPVPPPSERASASSTVTAALRILLPGTLLLTSLMARAGEIPLQPCRMEHPSRIAAVDAECGKLSALENPRDSRSRRIDLNIARVPAVSRRKKPDPLFVLAGGPGMGATLFYASAAPAFARIHRDRDIVLVDQRGTGGSNGLQCDLDEESLMTATDETLLLATRQCLETLNARADVRFYTTSLAVQDLDGVRAALGYEQINLYGVSYGTRVAQHYLRRFPQRSRSVILDGVVPPQLALGPSIALDAEAAVANILTRCSQDKACHAKFGDPTVAYRALREALEKRPVRVELANPTTGEPMEVEFSNLHLATVLRLASYTSEQAALLPLSLDQANRAGNYTPLAAQYLIVSRAYENAVAFGMHNTVVCTEDVPFYDSARIDRAKLASTFLGASQLDALVAICKIWPRGPMDADFHAPLKTAVPALLLSGGNDPVTPASFGKQAAAGFVNGVHLILAGLGHGQLAAPCVDRLMAQLIEQGDAKQLDTSCARAAQPMPFFTTLAGPLP